MEEYYYYDLIFIGKVIQVEENPDEFRVDATFDFEPIEIFKGTKQDTFKITSASLPGTCGSEFKLGNRYLIFSKNGRTGSCSRNLAFDSDTLDLWSYEESHFLITLKDTGVAMNGAQVMQLLRQTKNIQLETLRKISSTPNGVVKSAFINGDLNSFITLEKGILNGPAEFYFQNRKLKFHGNFLNGTKEGYCEEYKLEPKKDYSGFQYIKEWGQYINDQRTGTWNYKVLEGSYKESNNYLNNNKPDEGEIKD